MQNTSVAEGEVRKMFDELEILKKVLPVIPCGDDVPVGPGDDCAAIDLGNGPMLLAAVDQLIADVHYLGQETPPEEAGLKLLKRNLSDIAAMGGVPRWALLTVAAGGRENDWISRFMLAVANGCRQYGVSLTGGDLAALAKGMEGDVSTLTILGTVEPETIRLRSGAKAGDRIFVTGTLGNSFYSGHHLHFEPRLREGRFLAQGGFASAMMDISDGLLLDAGRMTESSGLTMVLDPAALPLRQGADIAGALGDGEDYELLFAVPPEKVEKLHQMWEASFAPLHEIGVLQQGRPAILDPEGRELTRIYQNGYIHGT